MQKLRLLALATLLFAGYGASAQAALVDIELSPADCNVGVNCWTSNDPSNPSTSDIETLVGTSSTLISLYKQDVGAASDSGTFAGSYETTFSNTSTDPEDALIELVSGQDPIVCGECYLLVKDGNQTPSLYVFDLSAIDDMIESITLTDFWAAIGEDKGQGAISHVEIMGPRISEVPVPAAVWLFGTALLGFAGMARRTKV